MRWISIAYTALRRHNKPVSALIVWKTLLPVALIKRESTGVQQELEEVGTQVPVHFFWHGKN